MRALQLSMAAASVVVSLGLAELGARLLTGGALPYLNIYAEDPRYGVRLAPGATARIHSREGRVTTIETNAHGFRGPEWFVGRTRPRALLLGDSQMMGYGVDATDATGALVRSHEVLVAATPTWGPIEYARAVEDLAPVYRPDVVLFVANLANDWPESNVPNTLRHQAEDGWVVGKRERPRSFPLRSWLLGESRLVFAARALVADRDGPASDVPGGARAAERLLQDLPALSRPVGGDRSRVTRHLASVMGTCGRLGCTVIAAVLPLDVEVDPTAWAKYRVAPRDLGRLEPLAEAFLDDARRLGATTVDLRAALAAASPGAFLPDDVHLSPRGHRAVADALSEALDGASLARWEAR